MPWSNQSGGGGGWKGGNGGPWGSGPQNSGGQQPPDLEEIIRRSQDKLKNVVPGGGSFGGKGIALVVVVLLGVWLLTGFYTVKQDEVGVELVFGQYTGTTQPGLNYNLPSPVGTVYRPKVLTVRETSIGSSGNNLEDSLMLTGDENIVDIDFKVQWRIQNARDFLFNVEDPETAVRQVAESAMREIIGNSDIEPILTENRAGTEAAVLELMQKTLDDYAAGISIRQVQTQNVNPPREVIDAFRDVQAAKADQERVQNEAETYANKVVPEARGEAARILEAANGYKDQVVANATGQADRFSKVYGAYKTAPDVTRKRLFLETMEEVLAGQNKIIIDNDGNGSGVVPFLPLDRLTGTNTGAAR